MNRLIPSVFARWIVCCYSFLNRFTKCHRFCEYFRVKHLAKTSANRLWKSEILSWTSLSTFEFRPLDHHKFDSVWRIYLGKAQHNGKNSWRLWLWFKGGKFEKELDKVNCAKLWGVLWTVDTSCYMMHWWCADDALMIRWWCPDDALKMHWWCTDNVLMMSWWCTDDARIMHG